MIAASELLAQLTESENGNGAVPVPRPLLALTWTRVSTEMQEERGLSLGVQLAQIREYAERKGIEVVGEYSETGSAFQGEEKRLEFHRMIDRAKSDPLIDTIIVHDKAPN